MKKKHRLELVSYTDYNQLFLKLCKDVEIAIKELKIQHQIFILELS